MTREQLVGAGFWAAVILGAFYFGFLLFGPPESLTLAEAKDRDQVTVTIGGITPASDDATADQSGQSVNVTVSTNSDPPWRGMNVTIPAGTFIFTSETGKQRLMTAKTIVFTLTGSNPMQTQVIPVYCLDLFMEPPTDASDLTLAATPSEEEQGQTAAAPTIAPVATAVAPQRMAVPAGYDVEETNSVRKLIDCLQGQNSTETSRQLAVWMVGYSYLQSSQNDVEQKLHDHLRDYFYAHPDIIREGAEQGMRSKSPDIDYDELKKMSDYVMSHDLDHLIDEAAAAKASTMMNGFRNDAPSLLDECGYTTSGTAFYSQ
jgi:hypothetical protein